VQVPGQVQRGSGDGSEGSGEGLAGFGAERVQEALVQSQARFNRVPEKVPEKAWCRARSTEKVPEKVWEASAQSQVKFNRVRRRFR